MRLHFFGGTYSRTYSLFRHLFRAVPVWGLDRDRICDECVDIYDTMQYIRSDVSALPDGLPQPSFCSEYTEAQAACLAQNSAPDHKSALILGRLAAFGEFWVDRPGAARV